MMSISIKDIIAFIGLCVTLGSILVYVTMTIGDLRGEIMVNSTLIQAQDTRIKSRENTITRRLDRIENKIDGLITQSKGD